MKIKPTFSLHTLHQRDRLWRPIDKAVENTMSTYWVNFAKTGNPNRNKLPDWKSYDAQSGNIMVLGDTIQQQLGLFKQAFHFLDGGF